MNIRSDMSRPTVFYPTGNVFSSLLTALMLVLGLCLTWAEGVDDDYLNIFGIIEQADMAAANGKVDSAQAKYLDARKKLVEFKRINPTYNQKAVAYRLNYLDGKLASLQAKAAASTVEPAKAPSAAQVKLISAGAEPRKALRLHPAAGDKQSMDMTIKMSMEMGTGAGAMPAMKMPAMKMGLEVTVKGVTGGDIAYETTIAEASAVDDPDASPQMAAGMEAAMAKLKGMTISGVTTDRGVSKDMDFKLPPGGDPQVQQTMDQVKTAMAQIALPEEAIGVGAKWTVQQKLKAQGMTIDQTETYEITALDDESVSLKTGLTQTAANQKIESPAAPGAKVDLTKMDTKGSGTATMNLGKLVPTAASMDGHSEMSMAIDMGGKKQTMAMKMDMNATIESK